MTDTSIVTIHSGDGRPRFRDAAGSPSATFQTPINTGSKRVFRLMGDDYITLRFNVYTPPAFALGDWCELPGFGRFVLAKPYAPSYDKATGGWTYELKMEAWHLKWRNKIMRFLPQAGGQETTWTLTTTPDRHLEQVVENANALAGLSDAARDDPSRPDNPEDVSKWAAAHPEFLWLAGENDSACKKWRGHADLSSYGEGNVAKTITYDSTSILDALNTIAQEYDCDWWVDGNYIRLGKCEASNTYVDLETGVNVAEMARSDSREQLVTRIIPFGSDRNISPRYRKDLIFDVKDARESGAEISDTARPLHWDMFPDVLYERDASGEIVRDASGNPVKTLEKLPADGVVQDIDIFPDGFATVKGVEALTAGDYEVAVAEKTIRDVHAGQWSLRLSGLRPGLRAFDRRNGPWLAIFNLSVSGFSPSATREFSYEKEYHANIPHEDYTARPGFEDVPVTLPDDLQSLTFRLTIKVRFGVPGRAELAIDAGPNPAVHDLIRFIDPDEAYMVKGVRVVVLKTDSKDADDYDRVIEGAVFNPAFGKGQSERNWLRLPAGESLRTGNRYLLPQIIEPKVKSSYFTSRYAAYTAYKDIAKYGVVAGRLMLPEKDSGGNLLPSYVDAVEQSEEQAVEDVVVFEDVYPKAVCTVTEVREVARDEEVENDDGTTTHRSFTAYRVKDDFFTASRPFSQAYMLDGVDLELTFQDGYRYRQEDGPSGGVTVPPWWTGGGTARLGDLVNPDSGRLNGWTFKAEFTRDPDGSAVWEIVRDNDAYVPNEFLRPEIGDQFVLTGIDVAAVGDLYVGKAEEELLRVARLYLDRLNTDPSTYSCTMMPDVMKGAFDNPRAYRLALGSRVNLINDAFVPTTLNTRTDGALPYPEMPEDARVGRLSRVIGFEVQLDYPWDNPVYIVGEKPAYSRLGAIQDSVDGLTYAMSGGVYEAGGSGSGVRVLRLGDPSLPTDENVLSSLRSLDEFPSRKRDEKIEHRWAFLKGAEAGKFSQGVSGAAVDPLGNAEVETIEARDTASFRRGATFGHFTHGMETGTGGRVDGEGNAEFESIISRSFLKVRELIYNRLNAVEGDTSFADSGSIEYVQYIACNAAGQPVSRKDGVETVLSDPRSYVEEEDPSLWPTPVLRVKMRRRWEGDFTPFQMGDILYGYINNLFTQGTAPKEFCKWWSRVAYVDRVENKLILVSYPDARVPSGHNFDGVVEPGTMITRFGNDLPATADNWADYPAVIAKRTGTDASGSPVTEFYNTRQRSFYISCDDGNLVMLQKVDDPKLETYNYGMSLGTLPTWLTTLLDNRVDPDQPYLYGRGIVVQDLIRLDYNDRPVAEMNYRGEWNLRDASSEKEYYRATKQFYDVVSHEGCMWKCEVEHADTNPPSDANTQWGRMTRQPDIPDLEAVTLWQIVPSSNAVHVYRDGRVIPGRITASVDRHSTTSGLTSFHDAASLDAAGALLQYSTGSQWVNMVMGDAGSLALEDGSGVLSLETGDGEVTLGDSGVPVSMIGDYILLRLVRNDGSSELLDLKRVAVTRDAVETFTSFVFTRFAADASASSPAAPVGGTYANGGLPDNSDVWSDGIPASTGDDVPLWMSRRVFASDGSDRGGWTQPVLMSDTPDFDAQYCAGESYPARMPDGVHSADDGLWHDPAREGDVWMATRSRTNGKWGTWGVARIKGERGSDGSGRGKFVSTVFKRSPLASRPAEIADTEGSYESPVPAGWSDGVPPGTDPVWASSRMFTSDGQGQDAHWSAVRLMMDAPDFDVQYCQSPDTPAAPTGHHLPVDGIWHDEPLQSDNWMATDHRASGSEQWAGWAITRIKGESGRGYMTSYVFTRFTPTTASPLPADPVGGSFANGGLPDNSDVWSDGIPAGDAPVWMSYRTFTSDGQGQGQWAPPVLMADNPDLDILYSSQEAQPSAAQYPKGHHEEAEDDVWHVRGTPSDIWMAVSRRVNGEWSGWSVVRIKGERGADGRGRFKSLVFMRSPADTRPATPAATAGDFLNPVPAGWSDGIPAGTGAVWCSTRTFTSDGIGQDAAWADPQLMADSGDFDVEYSASETMPSDPDDTLGHPYPGDSAWHNDGTPSDIWMATASRGAAGTWSAWTVTRIRGERGESGRGRFVSTVFKRGPLSPAPSVPGAEEGSYTSPVPTGWSDGIPAGTASLWATSRVFTSDGVGQDSQWGDVVLMADTGDFDVEYSSSATKPSLPDSALGHPYPGDAVWHNDGDENDIWMATASKTSGNEWSDWTLTRIKGENGQDGASVNLITNYYLASASDTGVTRPATDLSDGWTDTPAAQDFGQAKPYLWNYEKAEYTRGKAATYTEPVIISRWTADGLGVSGIEEQYALTRAANTVPTKADWSDTVPEMNPTMRFLWNRERTVYTDGSATAWSAGHIIGVYGERGLPGEDGAGSFVSVVFKRCALGVTPTKPAASEGSFASPVPDGWSDGIPAGDGERVWSTSRFFTSDGENQDAEWSDVALMLDGDCFDVQYCYSDSVPAREPSGHYVDDDGLWHDAPQTRDNWMATDHRASGSEQWAGWAITRIKGEDGKDGTSVTFKSSALGPYPTMTEALPVLQAAAASNSGKTLFVMADSNDLETEESARPVWYAHCVGGQTDRNGNVVISRVKANIGDAFLGETDGHLYVATATEWHDAGEIRGPQGDDGVSTYIHIRYATHLPVAGETNAQVFTANSGLTPGDYIGMAVTHEVTSPANWEDYSPWTRWTGQDAPGTEYIFKRTATEAEHPDVPSSSGVADAVFQADDYVPDGWTDDPSGITATLRYEWLCSRRKSAGRWGDFQGSADDPTKAALYAHYGADGLEFFYSIVFKRQMPTAKGLGPATPTNGTGGGTFENPVPVGWSDGIPAGSDPVWASSRKFCSDGNHGTWSAPAMMADSGDIDLAYSALATKPSPPSNTTHPFAQDDAVWHDDPREGDIWMAICRRVAGELWGSWEVVRIKGENGSNGAYVSYVFLQSDTQPATPTDTEHVIPQTPDVWCDGPSGAGRWWMSMATISGDTGKPVTPAGAATPWSFPVQCTCEDGIDGPHTDFKYRSFAEDTVAVLTESERKKRNPTGWADTPPTHRAGYATWMITARIDGDGNLDGMWSQPVRITGEKGEDGETPVVTFVSTVFMRASAQPSAPVGGSFDSPLPTTAGWSDGIPDGELPIWASYRRFYSDGSSGAGWSEPAYMCDNPDFDVQYNASETQPAEPLGHHLASDANGWHDTASTADIWMATANRSMGEWSPWHITRIKGEKGENGTSFTPKGAAHGHYATTDLCLADTTMASGDLGLCDSDGGVAGPWVLALTQLAGTKGGTTPTVTSSVLAASVSDAYTTPDFHLWVAAENGWTDMGLIQGPKGDDGEDGQSRFKSTVFTRRQQRPATPTNNSDPAAYPFGGSYESPVPDAPLGADYQWSDGIPSGTLPLWATCRTFTSDGQGQSNWTTPQLMADSAYFDVDYSSLENPPAPTGHPNTAQGWSNDGDDNSVWMATCHAPAGGQWTDWVVTKIKGENGRDGSDGADALSVTLSPSSLAFRHNSQLAQTLSVRCVAMSGATALPDGSEGVTLLPPDALPDGLTAAYGKHAGTTNTDYSVLELTLAADKVVNASLALTAGVCPPGSTSPVLFDLPLPVTTTERGAQVRGPRIWSDVADGSPFMSGAAGEPYIDVVITGTMENRAVWRCIRSHDKDASLAPTADATAPGYPYWQQADLAAFTATDLALTRLLRAEEIDVDNLTVRRLLVQDGGYPARSCNVTDGIVRFAFPPATMVQYYMPGVEYEASVAENAELPHNPILPDDFLENNGPYNRVSDGAAIGAHPMLAEHGGYSTFYDFNGKAKWRVGPKGTLVILGYGWWSYNNRRLREDLTYNDDGTVNKAFPPAFATEGYPVLTDGSTHILKIWNRTCGDEPLADDDGNDVPADRYAVDQTLKNGDGAPADGYYCEPAPAVRIEYSNGNVDFKRAYWVYHDGQQIYAGTFSIYSLLASS